jgi:DNA-binding response OmpR family regulator
VSPEDPTSNLRVLVVSEDLPIREEAQFGFPTGVEIEFASDAREAFRVIEKRVPDVLVVDLQTGSAGGFSLAKEMAQRAKMRDVPILMLLERSQDAWLADQAGADRHRVKPLETHNLVADVLELAAS